MLIQLEENYKFKTKFGREQIREAEDELAEILKSRPKNALIIVLMSGAFVFASALLRQAKWRGEVLFMKASSYSATERQSQVEIEFDCLRNNVNGRDIILIEDIVDSGNTVNEVARFLKTKSGFKAKSVEVITLLLRAGTKKPENVDIMNYGLLLEDKDFVVGYGLDYDNNYRALNYIAALIPKVVNSKKIAGVKARD